MSDFNVVLSTFIYLLLLKAGIEFAFDQFVDVLIVDD
jgi:hypothetical protein